MQIDTKSFFVALHNKNLKYYTNFLSIRGFDPLISLERKILLAPSEFTCQMITGQSKCGKSTELLRLKANLEQQGFFVIYCQIESNYYNKTLESSDLLMQVAKCVSKELEGCNINLKPRYFKNLFREAVSFFKTPIDLGFEAELSLGIGKLTAKTRESSEFNSQLQKYLESETFNIQKSINSDIIEPANQRLIELGYKGLVVIVDNLEKYFDKDSDYSILTDKRVPLHINCHVIYTIPYRLMFLANERENVISNLGNGNRPLIIPNVPIKPLHSQQYMEGLGKLHEMILLRASPDAQYQHNLQLTTQIFDTHETMFRLFQIAGGNIGLILNLISSCLQMVDLPITSYAIDEAVRKHSDGLFFPLTEEQWNLLREVHDKHQLVIDNDKLSDCLDLLLSGYIFDYYDPMKGWFYAVHPFALEGRFNRELNSD
jgi:hypothetical protein